MQHSNPPNLPTLSSTSPITASTSSTSSTTSPVQSPTSNHHHHYHRRRHLPSSSSSTTAAIRDAASKAAKRELAAKVREDWSFTWPPYLPTPSSISPENGHETSTHPSEVLEWRVRELDSSSPSPSLSPTPHPLDKHHSSTTTNPYKFDSPDAIGTTFAELATQRRRKRRKLLEEEMSGNEGLRCWHARRDAWCGTRIRQRPRRQRSTPPISSNNLDGASSLPITPNSTNTSTEPQESDNDTDMSASSTESTESIVPLAPPLLSPKNPIRASITPQTYPSIYSKVVVQGLSPTVPINLSDLTRALVQGWKEDDQWPPKVSIPEPMFSSRRGTLGAKREGEVGERHPHLNRSVGAFKKVLGLEGRGSGGSSGQSKDGELGAKG